jgi:hypothetical protein
MYLCDGCCRVISVLACGTGNTAAATAASLDVTGSTAGSTGGCLAPAVVRELFIQLLLLSPQLTSADLKGLLLQVLLHLITTGAKGSQGCRRVGRDHQECKYVALQEMPDSLLLCKPLISS